MKKIIILSVCGIISIATYIFLSNQATLHDLSELSIANIEALSRDESLDCNYQPEKIDCSIRVSGDLAAKIVGIAFVETDAGGELIVYGNECRSGGSMTCKPLRCDEIWSIIFGR